MTPKKNPIKINHTDKDGNYYPLVIAGPDGWIAFTEVDVWEVGKELKLLRKMRENQNLIIAENKRFREFINKSIELQKELTTSLEQSIMSLVWWMPNQNSIKKEIQKQKQLVDKFENEVKQIFGGNDENAG